MRKLNVGTAILFGRFMIISAMLLAITSCSPRYILVPPLPDIQPQKNDYSGIDLYLTSFKILKSSSTDDQSDVLLVKSKFIDYIKAQNSFHDVSDATLQFSPQKNMPYVTMDAQVEPTLTKHHILLLDILFIYPGCGYLPIPEPRWGTANVKTNVIVKDMHGITLSAYSKESLQKFNMLFYSLYRTEPMEDAFKAGYQGSFTQVSGALAQDLSRISAAAKTAESIPAEPEKTGQAEIGPATFNQNQKSPLLSTIYARTSFQASFMNIAATILGDALLPIAGGTAINMNNIAAKSVLESNANTGIKQSVINNTVNANKQVINGVLESKNGLEEMDAAKKRKQGNQFEEKLGDFSVLSYLYNTLDSMKAAIKQFDISITTNNKESASITQRITANNKKQPAVPYTSVFSNENYQYIASFKVKYGIGARAGSEQFGFVKKYRQYIRLVGKIIDTKSNKTVWENKIIVFGDAYQGATAAKSASGEELKNTFIILCKNMAEILINDINGNFRFNSKEEMVDWTPEDYQL